MTSNKPQKILILTREFTLGGACYLAIRLIKKLVIQYHVDLLIVGPSDDEMLAELPKSVSTYKLNPNASNFKSGYFGTQNIVNQITFTKTLHTLVPFNNFYDVLISTSIFPSWPACVAHANINARHKIIFLVDESLGCFNSLSLGTKTAVELSILCSETIVSVSKSLFDCLVQKCSPLKSKPLIILPPIIDDKFDEFNALQNTNPLRTSNKLIVLTVARLSSEKRIMDCLRIHHELHEEGIFFDWYIVGEGNEKDNIKREVSRLRRENSFILVGAQKNIPEWMANADIFVLFSNSEGCPTVVLEALHMQCPVITTAVHGVSEFIQNEVNGLIVSLDINEMKQGLKRMLVNEALRNAFKKHLSNNLIKSRMEVGFKSLIDSFEHQEFTQTTTPSVSILIPTYMQENMLDKAIASALMQNFESLEVVVVDDCSDDSTENLCKKWLIDPRFRYVRNEQNKGRVANYQNALFNIARGEWVLMLDGDDYLNKPDFIKKCIILIEQYKHSNLVFLQAGHTVSFINNSNDDVDVLPEISTEHMLMSGADYLKFIFKTGFFTHLGILCNRKLAIKNKCYQLDISSSDMESFLRLALEGNVILINETVGCWVQHGLNASSSVPINKISENVILFRDVTNLAIKKALLKGSEIDHLLTSYQAHALAYLYWNAIQRQPSANLSFIHLLEMIYSIHPRLFFTKKIIKLILKSMLLKFKATAHES